MKLSPTAVEFYGHMCRLGLAEDTRNRYVSAVHNFLCWVVGEGGASCPEQLGPDRARVYRDLLQRSYSRVVARRDLCAIRLFCRVRAVAQGVPDPFAGVFLEPEPRSVDKGLRVRALEALRAQPLTVSREHGDMGGLRDRTAVLLALSIPISLACVSRLQRAHIILDASPKLLCAGVERPLAAEDVDTFQAYLRQRDVLAPPAADGGWIAPLVMPLKGTIKLLTKSSMDQIWCSEINRLGWSLAERRELRASINL